MPVPPPAGSGSLAVITAVASTWCWFWLDPESRGTSSLGFEPLELLGAETCLDDLRREAGPDLGEQPAVQGDASFAGWTSWGLHIMLIQLTVAAFLAVALMSALRSGAPHAGQGVAPTLDDSVPLERASPEEEGHSLGTAGLAPAPQQSGDEREYDVREAMTPPRGRSAATPNATPNRALRAPWPSASPCSSSLFLGSPRESVPHFDITDAEDAEDEEDLPSCSASQRELYSSSADHWVRSRRISAGTITSGGLNTPESVPERSESHGSTHLYDPGSRLPRYGTPQSGVEAELRGTCEELRQELEDIRDRWSEEQALLEERGTELMSIKCENAQLLATQEQLQQHLTQEEARADGLRWQAGVLRWLSSGRNENAADGAGGKGGQRHSEEEEEAASGSLQEDFNESRQRLEQSECVVQNLRSEVESLTQLKEELGTSRGALEAEVESLRGRAEQSDELRKQLVEHNVESEGLKKALIESEGRTPGRRLLKGDCEIDGVSRTDSGTMTDDLVMPGRPKDREKQNLQASVTELTQERRSLAQMVEQRDASLQELRQEVAALTRSKERLEAAQPTIQEQEAENERLKSALCRHEEHSADMAVKMEGREAEHRRTIEESASQRLQQESACKGLNARIVELEATQRTIKEQEAENQRLKSALYRHEEHSENKDVKMKGRETEHREAIEESASERLQQERACKGLTARIAELEATQRTMQEQDAENEYLKSALYQYEEHSAAATDMIKKMDEEHIAAVTDMTKKMEGREAESASEHLQQEREIKGLNARIVELEATQRTTQVQDAENVYLKSALYQYEEHNAAATDMIKKMDEEHSAAVTDMTKKMEGREAESASEHLQQEREINGLNARIVDLEAERARRAPAERPTRDAEVHSLRGLAARVEGAQPHPAEHECNALQARLEALSVEETALRGKQLEEHAKMQSCLEKQHCEHEVLRRTLRSNEGRFEQQIRLMEKDCKQLKELNCELAKHNEKLGSETGLQVQELNTHATELQESRKSVSQLVKEIEGLRRENEDLKARVGKGADLEQHLKAVEAERCAHASQAKAEREAASQANAEREELTKELREFQEAHALEAAKHREEASRLQESASAARQALAKYEAACSKGAQCRPRSEVLQAVASANGEINWVLLEPKELAVHASGSEGLREMKEWLSFDAVLFGLLRVTLRTQPSTITKQVFIQWVGPDVQVVKRGQLVSKYGEAVEHARSFCSLALEKKADSLDDLVEEDIISQLKGAPSMMHRNDCGMQVTFPEKQTVDNRPPRKPSLRHSRSWGEEEFGQHGGSSFA